MVILASAQSHVKFSASERERETAKEPGAGEGDICDFCNNNKELTHYHCPYEQGDNNSEHPQQPLNRGERNRIKVKGEFIDVFWFCDKHTYTHTHQLSSYPWQNKKKTDC